MPYSLLLLPKCWKEHQLFPGIYWWNKEVQEILDILTALGKQTEMLYIFMSKETNKLLWNPSKVFFRRHKCRILCILYNNHIITITALTLTVYVNANFYSLAELLWGNVVAYSHNCCIFCNFTWLACLNCMRMVFCS